jgi:protoporphyrinogen oxidase
MIPLPEFNSTTCFYFAASHPPFNEPLLLLNGDNDGPINNLSVVSNVARNYAPAGQALISASVTGKLPMKSSDLSASVRQQLRRWFGFQVDSWSMLRSYEIPMALPSQRAGFSDMSRTPLSSAGVYHCGDYCETSSIHGAMLSGRKTAEALITDLSKAA